MSFSSTLLQWYDRYGRDLPWRHTRDAYAIWLSEVILQQTRIDQGRDYWLRFMQQWPDVHQLAKATEDQVMRQWQGLGYYSRARNLLKAAKAIDEMGRFPSTYSDLLKLKGVGPYTAAAVASLAFDEDVAVVDGNVYRVLARHFGIKTAINTTEGVKEFRQLAQALMPKGKAAAYNQALMDFGAICCTPSHPCCDNCPLADSCTALLNGNVQQLPVKQRKTVIKERHIDYVYIRCQGLTALHRRQPGDIWQGLWEPFCIEPGGVQPLPLPPGKGTLHLVRSNIRHQLTHRLIISNFYLWEAEDHPTLPPDYQWIAEQDIDLYGKPRLVELMLEEINSEAIEA